MYGAWRSQKKRHGKKKMSKSCIMHGLILCVKIDRDNGEDFDVGDEGIHCQ